MDDRLRRAERRLAAGEDALDTVNLERARVGLPKLRTAPPKPEPRDVDEHPACSVRNTLDKRAWKRARRRCGMTSGRYYKKKAHRADRRNVKSALRGEDAKADKRYATGRDID